MRDQLLRTHAPLGPRLARLALLCMALFALATIAGLFANGLA